MKHYDVIVIGSGFGGSVSALRLTEKGYRVAVLEAGPRFTSADFPKTNWNLRRYLWFPRLGMRGIQRLTLLPDVLILSGAGVGGGSLVYANTLYEPHDAFFTDEQWGDITDWKAELAPYFEQAERMLGATPHPTTTASDQVILEIADHFDVSDTYQPTPVGVFFGDKGEDVDDPFFGGVGPRRTGCVTCGGCMVGCRFNAKNSLDRNYLYLAEQAGAVVYPDTEAVDVVPIDEGGYAVATQRPGAWVRKQARSFSADQVILSAGSLGTTRLLMRMRTKGRLPYVSPRLGHNTRTNSEAILGATARTTDVDYSDGVAITSSIHPEPHTHIEPVRYSKGSNAMGLLGTILVDGGGRVPRPLRFLGQVVRHPIAFLRSLSVRRWAERTVILLVMQSLDNKIKLSLKKGLLGTRLTSTQDSTKPNPTYIPVANEAARVAAAVIDGNPVSAINEVLLDTPTTAHIIGGACIGADRQSGVIDPYQRLYGHEGLHVADGSVIAGNLGVNPALTITAMTERAMAHWPNKGEPDPRPPLGTAYVPVDIQPPRHPIVPADAPAAMRLY
ncbi:MAG: GMC family oxidoreductase [Acidimicrobiia bacterium]|nr:GMC family oxidoreductase [Acidimicrobiia bacterium]